eukprot:906997-Pyramimonas_sp.AAC.1
MQQTSAPDDSESVSVSTLKRFYSPSLLLKTDSTCQDDSKNTNSFADLARVADGVQTSRCIRRTRLMILNRLRMRISSAAPLQLELNTENR